MSRLDPQDLIDAALEGGAASAEVFTKSAVSIRLETGPFGVRSWEERREDGIAVRIWDGEGREGFVHADGREGRRADELVSCARQAAMAHPRGPVPRLPRPSKETSGRIPDLPQPSDDSDRGGRTPEAPRPSTGPLLRDLASGAAGERMLREARARLGEAALALIGAFGRPGREAVSLLKGWVEAGWTETHILNSLGGGARFSLPLVSAGLHVAAGPIERERGGPVSVSRYLAAVGDLDRLDPKLLVEEACWRVASSVGGEPAQGRGVGVLLDPRSAAAWLRSVLPFFRRGPVAPPACAWEPKGGFAVIRGFDLVDTPAGAPLVIPFDGEGRRVRSRLLLGDGVPRDCCVDSRDPDAAEGELGPMQRGSYRDPPEAGPLLPVLAAGRGGRDELIKELGTGLFVTAIAPCSLAGAPLFMAEVRGIWVEKGKARRPVTRTLLSLPTLAGVSRVVSWGSDLELDVAGSPVVAPSILFERADLQAL